MKSTELISREQLGQEQVRQALEWYVHNEQTFHNVFELMDGALDEREYLRLLRRFRDESMHLFVFFMLAKGRWCDRDISDVVRSAMMQRLLETWDDTALEKITQTILDGVEALVERNPSGQD